ncbi:MULTISPECIES: hypothetical protein [unclassified Streptomyces]|uniref:hypothetical protein n=1 Tax=unclassified Streptomyces TaxID=2593676 RepID=UPI0007C7D0FC|nr:MULTISPECIES: hypothetical protein [unclassified Streptomyces]
MTSDLERGVGELKKFRDRVDGIITELASGAGGAAGLNRNRMTRASLGVGIPFTEADGFSAEYDRVHGALVALSKSLGGQIELLQIGVYAADVGYDNVEDEQRRRFHGIQARLADEREKAIKREQETRNGDLAQPAQPREDTKSGEKGLG